MKDQSPLPPIDFVALAQALLSRAEALLAQWLPEGVLNGHEWECGNLGGGAGKSCKVNVRTGAWADFASGEQGRDLVSLYAAMHDLSAGKAAVQLAHEYGLEAVANVRTAANAGAAPAARALPAPSKPKTTPQPKEAEGWQVLAPVPAGAPAPNFWHYQRDRDQITHTARYARLVDGVELLYGYVVRFATSDGGKDTLPYVWCQNDRGECAWKWRTWPEPRPLYVPRADLGQAQRVVLVEGERKADVLQALLDAAVPDVYRVASWAGGCKAWAKADWAWLAGRDVLLWADADSKRTPLSKAERAACADATAQDIAASAKPLLPKDKQPGMAAMLAIGHALRSEHGCAVQLLPTPAPGEVADGWDCADAIETDGWDGERALAFFARAYALPAAGTSAAAQSPASAAQSGAPSIGKGDDMPWWLAPYWDAKKSCWLTSRKMVIGCLENDPLLNPVLAFNQFTNAPAALVDWPWASRTAGDVKDATDLMLGNWLSKTYGLPSINRTHLTEAVYTVAHSRPYHPVVDWLGAQVHDGEPRLDKWLMYVLGYDPAKMPPKLAEYMSLVGRFWLIGMVKRVFEPGCQFDYMPVLEGVTGRRKSSMIRELVGDDYFSDTQFDVGKGKDGLEMLQGVWVYEIAELSHFSRSEANAIKGFVTSRNDRYRASYGRSVESHPRQVVFVGTTNEREYLNDRTGNRRFWPIPCTDQVIKTEWVQKYRGQLFAEAVAAYRAGAVCAPTQAEEERLFAPMQSARLKESAVAAGLFHILTRTGDDDGNYLAKGITAQTRFVRIDQLCYALGADAGKAPALLQGEVRSLMAQWGWMPCKRQINGVRKNGYERPAVWPPTHGDDSIEDLNESPEVGAAIEDTDDVPF